METKIRMDKIRREPKETDRENIEKGIELLKNLIISNDQIEPTLWTSVFIYALMKGYKNSGFTYLEFKELMEEAFQHYQEWYEKGCH